MPEMGGMQGVFGRPTDDGDARSARSPSGSSRRQISAAMTSEPKTRNHRRLRRYAGVGFVVPLSVLFVVSCLEPELVDESPERGGELPDTADELAVNDEPLRAELRQLHETLDALDDLYDQARHAVDIQTAREAGIAALARLVDIDDVPPITDPPLLPAATPARGETPQRPAQLLSLVTTAQDTGGVLGRDIVAVMSDSVAGDLGGWLRDAEGMVEMARAVSTSADSIAELEPAVLDLAGEATRALAWTFVLVDVTVDADAQAAAERAQAHVGLIRDSLAIAGAPPS